MDAVRVGCTTPNGHGLFQVWTVSCVLRQTATAHRSPAASGGAGSYALLRGDRLRRACGVPDRAEDVAYDDHAHTCAEQHVQDDLGKYPRDATLTAPLRVFSSDRLVV